MIQQTLRSFATDDFCIISVSGIYADVMLNHLIACRNTLEFFVDLVLKLMPSLRKFIV